jgi:outer membrane lipoprotein SlyB
MADREFEITANTYLFAGVGAVILGGLAYASLGGLQNTIAAAVVGGLAGGCLGLFF